MKRENKIFNMVVTAVFAAVIAVGAFTSLRIATIPFTLQSFAVFLALGTIGWKRGTVSVIIYLLLGLVGAPVFRALRAVREFFSGLPAVFSQALFLWGLCTAGYPGCSRKQGCRDLP